MLTIVLEILSAFDGRNSGLTGARDASAS